MYGLYAMLQGVDPQADGLSFGEVLAGIPHDAPAFVMYALTFVAVGWIIWANRKKGSGPAS
jgi:hypothetical protein